MQEPLLDYHSGGAGCAVCLGVAAAAAAAAAGGERKEYGRERGKVFTEYDFGSLDMAC